VWVHRSPSAKRIGPHRCSRWRGRSPEDRRSEPGPPTQHGGPLPSTLRAGAAAVGMLRQAPRPWNRQGLRRLPSRYRLWRYARQIDICLPRLAPQFSPHPLLGRAPSPCRETDEFGALDPDDRTPRRTRPSPRPAQVRAEAPAADVGGFREEKAPVHRHQNLLSQAGFRYPVGGSQGPGGCGNPMAAPYGRTSVQV